MNPEIQSIKMTSSVHDITSNAKPPFGSRYLTDDLDVWSQNAWDHVPMPEDQLQKISASLAKQRLAPVPSDKTDTYNVKPSRHWDNFYKMNSDNFFRNRKWLHTEFPELAKATQPEGGCLTITEVGCGAGNSVFPLLAANENASLKIKAYDYSSHAVKLVQRNPLYIKPPNGSIDANVWDLTSDSLPEDMIPGSVDIVIAVFVMSALHPNEWSRAVKNIHEMLKPGGVVLFRDYGRYDLTQLRFKNGRLLDENFYVRGDKTRVYFFELDELSLLFTGSMLPPEQQRTFEAMTEEKRPSDTNSDSAAQHEPEDTHERDQDQERIDDESEFPTITSTSTDFTMDTKQPTIHPNLLAMLADHPPQHPLFATEQLGIDRRLIVNRKRQLKMFRVWMQGIFRKI